MLGTTPRDAWREHRESCIPSTGWQPTGGLSSKKERIAQRPHEGRVIAITGVGHRGGIGFVIAKSLLRDGARVLLHSFCPQEGGQSNRNDSSELGSLVAELGEVSGDLHPFEADLGDPAAPRRVVEKAVDIFGRIDGLVVNHAHSSDQPLASVTAEQLDRAWAVNARAAVLLAQAFVRAHDRERGDGRIVLFTSGQHLGPMPGELPYVLSKGAVHQVTRTLADEVADRGITVNAINPGPVDTGWPSNELRDRLRGAFPAGRWGRPHDIAPIVSWLLSDNSAWMTGQVIDAEGGFRRLPPSGT